MPGSPAAIDLATFLRHSGFVLRGKESILTAQRAAGLSLDFKAFFQAEHGRLLGLCYLLTGKPVDAEDLAQEAMVRALERWERVARMESPGGHVYRIVFNLNRHRFRRLRVRARLLVEPVHSSDDISRVEDRNEILVALRALSVGQRQAVILVDWLQFDADEAGRILGIEAASVRSRVHRARALLRNRLEDHYAES